ncbi:hypothetical protein [Modestobacter italicus]|uniref:hypothetical protein n=1 Tax=Modestobacter italicus (strain DSM 44449 / CECT 9708 / BC 501) TaxID=2732864 RepID=UPI001C937B84|nr:hypothetical protein [Modestobacter italicus]
MDDELPGGVRFAEPGGSWRPFWLTAAVLAVLAAGVLVLGVPALVVGALVVLVLGLVAAGCLAARRAWTVRVEGRGPDAVLRVGRERLPLTEVDAGHLRAVRGGAAGVDAGAPVLGGGWSLPRGRAGLPLRRTDGTTVLVPTRAPAQLSEALLTAHPAGGADTGRPGRVAP